MKNLYRFAASTACLWPLTVSGVAAAESDFIKTYVEARGGCRGMFAMQAFDSGAGSYDKPFGRSAEEWTDQDVAVLKQMMDDCVNSPATMKFDMRAFNLQQASKDLARVSFLIKEGRDRKEAREQQRVAQERQAAQDAVAARDAQSLEEINTFKGHIMSDAEIERAQQLKQTSPGLAAKIDGLLAAQDHLKQEGEEERKLALERADAARRLEGEHRKHELDEQLAAEEAKVEAEKKQADFERSLPVSCKQSQIIESGLQSKSMRDKVDKASSLAEAGDTQSACPTFTEMALKLEDVRVTLIRCTKDLENSSDPLAQQAASTALQDAIGIHGKQKDLAQQLRDMKCQ